MAPAGVVGRGGVEDAVLGLDVEPQSDVPAVHVRIHQGHVPPANGSQDHRQLAGQGRFAHAALRGPQGDHLPLPGCPAGGGRSGPEGLGRGRAPGALAPGGRYALILLGQLGAHPLDRARREGQRVDGLQLRAEHRLQRGAAGLRQAGDQDRVLRRPAQALGFRQAVSVDFGLHEDDLRGHLLHRPGCAGLLKEGQAGQDADRAAGANVELGHELPAQIGPDERQRAQRPVRGHAWLSPDAPLIPVMAGRCGHPSGVGEAAAVPVGPGGGPLGVGVGEAVSVAVGVGAIASLSA